MVEFYNDEHEYKKEWAAALPKIDKWMSELDVRAKRHRKHAHWTRDINRLLGGVNVALAAICATAVFAALKNNTTFSDVKRFTVAGIAVLPAIAAGLQKEFQLSAREQGHLLLTRDCRALQKQLEFLVAFPPEDIRTTLSEWHVRYTEAISRPVLLPKIAE